jgi:hypothetical protein
MSTQTKNQKIVGWATASVPAFISLSSAIPKFLSAPGNDIYVEFQKLGIHEITPMLGVMGIISAVLYLLPRTSVLGTIALFGYWSGALATELSHNMAPTVSIVVLVFLVVSGWFRAPEFFDRVLQRS